MAGENGTSHMGNVYHYYKCGRAKRRGKEHCDLRAICKEPLGHLQGAIGISRLFWICTTAIWSAIPSLTGQYWA